MKTKHNRANNGNQSGKTDFVIESLLPVGKENAISTKDLMQYLNCTERELREYISRERRKGAVICSATTGGYFKPKNHGELADCYNGLQKQAETIMDALKSMKRALQEEERLNE